MIIFIGLLGLIFGSFVNALVWRLHEQTLNPKSKLSIVNGRSICPNCKKTLKNIDLIPVISWFLIRGKCRYCKQNISPQYPLVELLGCLIFILSYQFWPYKVQGHEIALFSLWLLILTGLLALTVYDFKWKILPTRIIYVLVAISLIYSAINLGYSSSIISTLFNIILAAIIGGGLFYIIYQVSDGKWIGGGDIRLGWLLGILAGTPGKSILFIFLASLLGSLVSIPLLLAGKLKKNSVLPFGPFLIAGLIIVVLHGTQIITWYKNLFIS